MRWATTGKRTPEAAIGPYEPDSDIHSGNILPPRWQDRCSSEGGRTACSPFERDGGYFRREVASKTKRNEVAVSSVLIAAIVGSISSRSEVNMRLVSG